METYQTYPGRVRNGQPVINGNAVLPENANIFITVLNTTIFTESFDKTTSLQTDREQTHLEVLDEFVKAMADIDDEPLDDEFFAILAKRVNITRQCRQ